MIEAFQADNQVTIVGTTERRQQLQRTVESRADIKQTIITGIREPVDRQRVSEAIPSLGMAVLEAAWLSDRFLGASPF